MSNEKIKLPPVEFYQAKKAYEEKLLQNYQEKYKLLLKQTDWNANNLNLSKPVFEETLNLLRDISALHQNIIATKLAIKETHSCIVYGFDPALIPKGSL